MNLRPIPFTVCAFTLSLHAAPIVTGLPEKHSDPFSTEQWHPSDAELAFLIKRDLLILQAAIQNYAVEIKKPASTPVSFDDVKVYLREDSRLYRSHGKDMLGNPYLFSTIKDSAAVATETIVQLPTIPMAYWQTANGKCRRRLPSDRRVRTHLL